MNFTVSTIAKSLADYLRASFPGIKFLEDPNQQGTKIPCMFLQQRYSNIKLQTGGRWLRTIGLDLTYLEDYNLTNMQELYQAAAETLDLVMEMFPYSDGTGETSVFIRTYEREWRVDLDAMHYRFEIRELVTIPKEYVKMQSIKELKEEVKTIERK